jgi:AraC family transcriptional regulator of adaptative response/methylated-DNA-[protein]-cysteine methyltransferase
MVARLLDALASEPERRWRESDVAAMGYDISTVRRGFKRRFGISFLEMARRRRVGHAVESLASGASVIDAQLDAGFESGSGFRAAFGRLFGNAPVRLRGRDLLRADWLETPIGPMVAVADRHALHLLEFADRKALPREIRVIQDATGSAVVMGRFPPIDAVARDLSRYFYGCSDPFKTRLAGYGTPFERRVWEALRRIPAGATRGYGEIAAGIGRPGAGRAVARANGANPFAIIVPCHRVIGVDGALTGYGGGLWRKRWLLEHERRMALGDHTTPG